MNLARFFTGFLYFHIPLIVLIYDNIFINWRCYCLYPKEYIDYLIHFHGDRDYFECHEILEDYWKSVDPRNKHSIWVGLILLAVSNYHQRRENREGAIRTLSKSINIIKMNTHQLDCLGIDREIFLSDLEVRLKNLTDGNKYSSYIFPIIDQSLISLCKKKCLEAGINWCEDSDLTNEQLIHRHSLRDRSQVIHDRFLSLKIKSNR